MSITKVCCTCLSFDVEMLSLADTELRECLEKVTNIKIEIENELMQNVCTECVLMMRKFVKFKDRCLEANQRLRQMLSQSTYISEAMLQSESRKLYSETLISFDHVHVKQEIFLDEIDSNIDLEMTSDDESQTNSNIYSFKNEVKLENETQPLEADQNEIMLKPLIIESNKFEDTLLQMVPKEQGKAKILKISPPKKKLKSSRKKNASLVETKPASWKSDYAVQVALTKEQQIEEFLKREISEVYLKSPFKCSNCFTGFISKEKLEQHMGMHNESCSALQCDICKLSYSNLVRLRLHQRWHKIRYKCLSCGDLTKSQKKAVDHQNQHLGIVSYECKLCREKFKNQQLHRWHCRKAHPTDFACDLCGDFLPSQVRLEKHKRTKKCTRTSENIFECKMCDKPIFKLVSWYVHMLRHARESKERNPPSDCQICGQKTSSWNDWSNHIRSEHRNKNHDANQTVHKKTSKTFICDFCGKLSPTKYKLALHIHTQHMENPTDIRFYNFKWKDTCRICSKQILRTNMKRHLTTHTGEKPYKCGVCGKCFGQAYTRDEHIEGVHNKIDKTMEQRKRQNSREKSTESKEKPFKYPCSNCPAKFRTKLNLTAHERSHTGEKPYSCDVCQRSYVCKYYLEVHQNIHTGKKPYACNECDERFSNKAYLRTHIKKHTGEVFPCDICNKGFTKKSNLKKHQIVHTGVRNHTCDLCGKTFTARGSLGLHVKTVHLGLPHPPRKPRKRKITD